MTDNEGERPRDGEVLGPDVASSGETSPVGDNYIALISQYTERPDLLIDALERNDPGFVKRMNTKTEERSDRMADARFWFGGIQAYAGLAVAVIAALVVLGLLVYSVVVDGGKFWLVISFAVFFAVSQGGPSGFAELCRGIADFFRKNGSNPKE